MSKDDLEKYGVYELISERIKNSPRHSNFTSNTETISTPILRDRKEEEKKTNLKNTVKKK